MNQLTRKAMFGAAAAAVRASVVTDVYAGGPDDYVVLARVVVSGYLVDAPPAG